MMNNKNKQVKATILNVIPDERLGGPQLRVLQVAKLLKERGFRSIIAMPEGDKIFASLLNEASIPYYQVKNFKRIQPTLNPIAHIKWLLFFIPGVLSLAGLIRKNRVDIVHVNGHVYLQGPLAAKFSGAKLIWHLNDTRTHKLIRILLLPFLHLLANKIAVAAQAVNQRYFGNGTFAEKNILLYPPVDTTRFHPAYNVKGIRNDLGLEEQNRIIGTIGNINPCKGYEFFFPAAKLIKEDFPKARFLVVGKELDTQRKYWQRLHAMIKELQIEDDIILTGYRADIPELLNVVDVFVLASVFEAAPIVILEAMACARPIVATRVGGIPEMVIDGETGILVPSKDPRAISEAVLYLLNHPKEAKEMGLKGRQHVIDHFNLAICAKKHEEIYKAVI